MRIIELDASSWRTPLDALDAILSAVDAPAWHGRNLNALAESIGRGGINEVEPPYIIKLKGTRLAVPEVAVFVKEMREAVERAVEEFNARSGEPRHAHIVSADELA